MAVIGLTSHARLGRYKTLAAEYYQPLYVNAQQSTERLGKACLPLKNCVRVAHPITYGVLKPREVESSTFRLARIQNSEALFVFGDDLPPISAHQFDEHGRSEVRVGDIIIAIGGYIGPLGIISDAANCRLNINRHLARVSPDSNVVDGYYLAAYLASTVSQTLLVREVRGAVQAGINIADLKLHPVFLPNADDQRSIGDAMRTAENALRQSRHAYAAAQLFLESELSLDKLTFQRPVGYIAQLSDLEASHRSDAQHYEPRFNQLIAHIKGFPSARVRDIRSVNRRGLQPIYLENGEVDVVNSQHLGPKHIDYVGQEKTSAKLFASASEAHIQPNDLLVYTTGAYIGRTNVYLSDAPAMASNHVNILRLQPGIDAAYMALVFQSIVGQFQTQQHARGSAQAELYPSDIDRFVVPLIDIGKQQAIGDLVRESLVKQQQSRQLLEQAKTRVERLIEEAVQP